MQGPEFLIPVAFFASIFGIIYIYLSTRHRERMALIEKGADPALFKTATKFNTGGTLKFGLLLIGVALGILMGAGLHAVMPGMREEATNFSMIFLFGGLALVVNHIIESKKPTSQKPG